MRISYEYRVFPNCPRATEYSKEREQLTMYILILVLILDFLAILIYVPSVLLFPTEADWEFLCLGFGAVVLCGFVTFCTFVRRPLVTEMNLKIILDQEKIAPLPESLRKDDYAQLRTGLKRTVLEAAKSASIYFIYGLGIVTGTLLAIVSLRKGYALAAVIEALAVVALVAIVSRYSLKRKKEREKTAAERFKATHKSIIKNDAFPKLKNDENWVCGKCGSKNKINAIFCKDCGTYK